MLTFGGYYLSTHKLGDRASDCQDAIFLDQAAGIIALADGATQSFFAKTWAQELVKGYVRLRATGSFDPSAWLYEAQQRWLAGVQEIAEGTGDVFLINNLTGREAAYSTFLAVRYFPPADNQAGLMVEAEAIGDSCLLHFSRGRLLRGFPIATPRMFSNQTLALSSRQASNRLELAKLNLRASEGDHIVLATDAFARFLLQASEAMSPALSEFLALSDKSAVEEFIRRQRNAKNAPLENDDIALVSLNCCYNAGLIEDFSFSTMCAEPTDKQVRAHGEYSQDTRGGWRGGPLSDHDSHDANGKGSATNPLTRLAPLLRVTARSLFAISWFAMIFALTSSYFTLRALRKDINGLNKAISTISGRETDLSKQVAELERKLQAETHQATGGTMALPASSGAKPAVAGGKGAHRAHGRLRLRGSSQKP